jgi:hypothetical protein
MAVPPGPKGKKQQGGNERTQSQRQRKREKKGLWEKDERHDAKVNESDKQI